jgi:hypothetical protein
VFFSNPPFFGTEAVLILKELWGYIVIWNSVISNQENGDIENPIYRKHREHRRSWVVL